MRLSRRNAAGLEGRFDPARTKVMAKFEPLRSGLWPVPILDRGKNAVIPAIRSAVNHPLTKKMAVFSRSCTVSAGFLCQG